MSISRKMQDVVAKLLRQAEDVTGTPEELVFQAKAFELMAKYGIEQTEVDAARAGIDMSQNRDAIRKDFVLSGTYVYQQALLVNAIARALHGQSVWQARKSTLIVFAVPAHMERIEFLVSILKPQMLRQVKVVRPADRPIRRYNEYTRETYIAGYSPANAGQVRSFRRSWIAGFGAAVGERIREQETKAVKAATSTAVALYETDEKRASLALRAEFPRLGKSSTATYGDGYSQGHAAGSSAAFQGALA